MMCCCEPQEVEISCHCMNSDTENSVNTDSDRTMNKSENVTLTWKIFMINVAQLIWM